MKHLLNVIKDLFDPRDHVVAPNTPSGAVAVDFREQVPYVKNQGQEGSCTGHGIGSHFELCVRQRKSQVPESFARADIRLSPQFLYGQERILDKDFSQDAGSSLRSGFQVMSRIGCCTEDLFPYTDDGVLRLPGAAQKAQAANFRFQAYHRILDVDTAKSVLVSGYSFAIGIPLFEQFESDEAAESGLIRMPGFRATPIGGHCMHVVGAHDDAKVFDQTGAFVVQNSWGADWGQKGFCLLPYAYVQALLSETDMWVGHFGRPWAAPLASVPVGLTR